MEAFGASQDDIDQARAQIDQAAKPETEAACVVYAENWQAVMAFLALGPRWQYVAVPLQPAGMHLQRIGFDWAGVEAWIGRHVRPRKRRAISTDLQTMERAALQADNEQREKKE